MRPIKLFPIVSALCALIYGGCAHAVPKELADARTAYREAAAGPAQRENPAQLHTAERALALAEASFRDEGDSVRTRDRAYVALRRSQRAEAEARQVEYERQLALLEQNVSQRQQAEMARLRGQYQATQQALSAEQQARMEAESRAQSTASELARVATVKQEARGMVITLSGQVLFPSGKAELLPSARASLDQVANALLHANPDATIVVEGHTDSRGSEALNLDLSTRRAQVVREYLTAHGVAPERVRAEGFGFSRPVADNKTVEGRANNRRVEIVVQPQDQGRPPAQGLGPHG